MTFRQKRKQNKKEHLKYLFPHYTEEDIKRFSPEHFSDFKSALDALDQEITKTARMNGFYKSEVLEAGYSRVVEEVKKLWKEEQ